MADKALGEPQETTAEIGAGQDAKVLQVNITNRDKKQRIRNAIRSFGYSKVGTGVTEVLLTFADDERVQAAVRRSLGRFAPTPAGEG